MLLDISGEEPVLIQQDVKMASYVSTSVYLDGYLYGFSGNQNSLWPLRCLDAASGEVMWDREMRTAFISAVNGTLLVLEQTGVLHIVEATPSEYSEIVEWELPFKNKALRAWAAPVYYDQKIYCKNQAGEIICIDVSG